MKLPTLSATVAFATATVPALLVVISAVLGATGGAVVCVAAIQLVVLLVLLGGHKAQPTTLDQVIQDQREALARLELRVTAADERAVTEARATTKELSALIAAQRG